MKHFMIVGGEIPSLLNDGENDEVNVSGDVGGRGKRGLGRIGNKQGGNIGILGSKDNKKGGKKGHGSKNEVLVNSFVNVNEKELNNNANAVGHNEKLNVVTNDISNEYNNPYIDDSLMANPSVYQRHKQ